MFASAASTSCSVVTMSTCQLKNRSTSADPRLVIERTCCSPGTVFTDSSIGRVIVTIIWSIGITPLSTPMMTRGKSVVGKTEIGMVKARYAPAAASTSTRNTSDLEKRVNQKRSSVGRAVRSCRNQDRSLAGTLILPLVAGRFGRCRPRRRSDLHLRVIRQRIAAIDDQRFASGQTLGDLHSIAFPNAGFNRDLMSAVAAHHHHDVGAVRRFLQGRRWNDNGIVHRLRHRRNLH